jgi:hypothetical protein
MEKLDELERMAIERNLIDNRGVPFSCDVDIKKGDKVYLVDKNKVSNVIPNDKYDHVYYLGRALRDSEKGVVYIKPQL